MNDPKQVPGQYFPGAGAESPASAERPSSIERAMRAFDRQEFVPPSMPNDMLPQALNPAGYPGVAGQPPMGQPPMGQPPMGYPGMGAPGMGNPAGGNWPAQPGYTPFPGGQPHPGGHPGMVGNPAAPAPSAPQGNGLIPEPPRGWANVGQAQGRPGNPVQGHPAQGRPAQGAPTGWQQPGQPGPAPQGYPQPGAGYPRPGAAPFAPQGAPHPGMAPAPGVPGQNFPGQGYGAQVGYRPEPAPARPGNGYAGGAAPAATYGHAPVPGQQAPAAASGGQAPGYRDPRTVTLPQGYYPIDRRRLAEAGMLGTEAASAGQVEEFRIVKRQIIEQADDMRRRGGGGAAQRVMVCSPLAGEGKTFCAVNLAMSISAEKESEVLLVDFDLARASVLHLLGLPPGPGLMEALVDPSMDIRSCVMATDIPGLSILPGGRPTNSDTEYLASSRAATVLDQLTEDAPQRIVIFDSPPALAASIPAELAKLMGQVVLVVLADKTSSGAVQDAASLLSGCPNVQLLLNSVQFSPNGRKFGSYHGYRG